jgi:polysaccharide export outer membrane protein
MKAFIVAALVLAPILAVPRLVAQQKSETDRPAASASEPAKPETVEPAKPMAVPVSVDPHTYRLGADDVIFVRVWREPDLSGMTAVRPDGKITMPLINEVKAAGLTPNELAAQITDLLSKYVNSPQVMVAVQSVRSKRYFVSGEVFRPGAYPLATPTRVFEAITMAGGFREFANKKKVVILRGAKRFKFNWNDVVKGKNLSQNIYLENGDQIVVP